MRFSRVHGGYVFFLCLASFLLGRLRFASIDTELASTAAPEVPACLPTCLPACLSPCSLSLINFCELTGPQIDNAETQLRRRDLRELHVGELQQQQQQQQPQLPVIDALDPAQLESFLLDTSGLLKVRPALKAAESGDNFLHAIPFQVSGCLRVPEICVTHVLSYPAAHLPRSSPGTHASLYTQALWMRSGLTTLLPWQVRPSTHQEWRSGRGRSLIWTSKCAPAKVRLTVPPAWESGLPFDHPGTRAGTYMNSMQDPEGVLAWVEERIAAVTLIPKNHGEVGLPSAVPR